MSRLLPLFQVARASGLPLLVLLVSASLAAPASAQIDGIGDPIDPGPSFPVSRFEVRYLNPHPDQPPLASILPLRVRLGTAASGFIAPNRDRPSTLVEIGGPGGEPLPYHAGAIGAVSAALLAALQQRGLLGVYVQPDPADIDVDAERDLRPEGDTVLHLVVMTARVRQLRTIAAGDRVTGEWRIDNVIHDRIRTRSPIQPTGADREDTTDLVNRKILDDYLFRLNRHPGRRVDAALAPADDGEGVSLDFLVHEAKPWYVYAQVSNTGTQEQAKWQQRFGYTNNQLLDRDDTLTFEYFRAGTDQLNGVSTSYEAPWFDSPRPWWWNRPSDGPDWLSWLDRSKLPWWGNDFLRWRVAGSYTSYKTEVDLGNVGKEDLDGEDFNVSGRLIYNVFQYRAFFLDLFGGLEGRGLVVDNKNSLREINASRWFVIPQGGFDVERITPVSALFGEVLFEGSVNSTGHQKITTQLQNGNNPATGIDALGRADPDDTWLVMRGELGLSQYLEPLLNPSGWEDPTTARSSTLAHEIALGLRGQWAFGYRLVPQAEQVAGGLYSVRGYSQSAAVGDNVLIGSVEYRFHLPHSLPVAREPAHLPLLGDFRLAPQQVYGRADWDLILRAFVDSAVTHANKRPDRSLEPDEFLLGAGLGAELVIRNNFRARFDWGRALKSNDSTSNEVDAGHDEFHLLFTVMY